MAGNDVANNKNVALLGAIALSLALAACSSDSEDGNEMNGDALPDAIFEVTELPGGTIANVFAVNRGGVSLLAQLNDGATVQIVANHSPTEVTFARGLFLK